MHLLSHHLSTDSIASCITRWHMSGLLIEATWQAPFTLQRVKICSYGCHCGNDSLLPSSQARALSKDSTDTLMSWLVCETLCTTLDLDDPLLLDIMMARMQARGQLLDAVTVSDNRHFNGSCDSCQCSITDESDQNRREHYTEPQVPFSLSTTFKV